MSEGKLLYQEAKEKLLEDMEFRKFIRDAIADGLESCSVCPVPEEMRENMAQWAKSVKAVGKGNIEEGIERMKKNHEFVHGLRKAQTKVGMWVGRAVIVAFIGTLLALIGKGIWGNQLPWK